MSKHPTKFELYSVFVTTVIANEGKRVQASAIYLSLISAGVAVWGIVKDIDSIFIIVPIGLISMFWLFTIVHYRKLSKAKFHVIDQLEKDWDLSPFAAEWDYLESNRKGVASGIELTHIEMLIPLIILIGCICYIAYWSLKACI